MGTNLHAPGDPARLLLVDDHEIARAGLRAILATEPGWRVVGEARDGAEGVALCRRLNPDLVLMDVRMPDMDGITATEAILAERPETRVVITTIYEDPDYLRRALAAGAVGYVLKDATRADLVGAVRQALQGEYPIDQGLAAQALRRVLPDAPSPPATGGNQLTRRELEVLQHLVHGLTNRQIGERLYISAGTVKLHVAQILAKLDAVDRTQAAVRGVELGLVRATPDD